MRPAVLLLISAAISLAGARSARSSPEVPPEKLPDYLDRLASTSPRDADAYVALAKWCLEQGLDAEARQAFEQAIAIDSDCPAARAALGYVRYGTGWRREGAPSRRPPARRPAGSGSTVEPRDEGRTDSHRTRDGRKGITAVAEARGSAERPAESLAGTETVPNRLEEKKNWAAQAADRFGISFTTYEDRDFLVHSTFSRKDRNFRRVLDDLRGLRKIVSGVLGARSRTVIWPDKLQIVLLRSEPEYDRFALNIDGLQSARNPQGAYTKGDHTVLFKPDSEALPALIGRTALDEVYDSDRPVGWWLRDGVEKVVVAGSPWGTSRNYWEQAFVDAASTLSEDKEGAGIFMLLETADEPRRRSEKNSALAMTLTQYLMKRSRRGFTEFVKELKSDQAPPPTTTTDGVNTYLLNYVSFQEKALKSHFNMSVPVLGERWKDYVVRNGEKLKTEMERREEERQERERRDREAGRYARPPRR